MGKVISSSIHSFIFEIFASSTLYTHCVVELLIDLNFEAMALLHLKCVVDFSVVFHCGEFRRDKCIFRVIQTL